MTESRESPVPKEVGKTEKKAFRDRIKSLINPPSFEQMFGVSVAQVEANPSLLDQMPEDSGDPFAQLTKEYKKDNKFISVWMPVPEVAGCGNFKYTVIVEEIILTTDQGDRIKKNKHWEIPDDAEESRFGYEESEVVFDKNGKRRPGPFANLSDEELSRRIRGVLSTEETMGSRIVTPERYYEVMSILNSLTPEDEI